MIKKEVKILNELGLHARPSTEISKISRSYDVSTKITITNPLNGVVADARSILSLLSLGADKSQTVVLSVDGKDEERAFTEIAAVIENFTVD